MIFTLINLILPIINNTQNSIIQAETLAESIAQEQIFGLKLMQFFVPINAHGIPNLHRLIDNYNRNSFFVNENIGTYSGIIGALGFVFLIIFLFIKKESPLFKRLSLLAEMNIIMAFFGITGGIGTMFTLYITNVMTGFNKISIFIAFVCILAIAFIVNEFYQKKKSKIFAAICICISLFCIWEQLI